MKTKMNYLLDRKSFYKNKETRNNKPIFLIIILVVVLILLAFLFRKSIAGINLAILGPVLEVQSNLVAKTDSSLNFFSGRKKLEAENRALKNEIKRLKGNLVQANINQTELASLRQIYNRPDSTKPVAVGKIISNPKHPMSDTIIADIGKSSDLNLGSLAVSQSVLLGEVVLISNQYSKVKLYSSANTKLAVRIGQSAIPAEAVGKGGGNFISKLPRGTEILKGDTVARLNGQLIGVVESIEESEEDPFQSIFIRVPVNLKQLNFVEFYE